MYDCSLGYPTFEPWYSEFLSVRVLPTENCDFATLMEVSGEDEVVSSPKNRTHGHLIKDSLTPVKVCPRCLDYTTFYKDRSRYDGWSYCCKECIRKASRKQIKYYYFPHKFPGRKYFSSSTRKKFDKWEVKGYQVYLCLGHKEAVYRWGRWKRPEFENLLEYEVWKRRTYGTGNSTS